MSFIMIQVHDSDDIPHVSFTRATRHDEIDDLTRINLVINLFHSEEEEKKEKISINFVVEHCVEEEERKRFLVETKRKI